MKLTQTHDTLANFIIIQDGALDEAWLDEVERNARNTMLKAYAREIASECVVGTIKALSFMGGAILELFEAAAEEGKR